MSVTDPSRTTRRLLKIATLGLAALLAGLLSGCSSTTLTLLLPTHNDTDWHTSQTYASATAALPARSATARIPLPRTCSAAPCNLRIAANRSHPARHRM